MNKHRLCMAESFVLCLVLSQGAAIYSQPLNVSFNLESTITLNQPVAIEVAFRNQGADIFELDLGYNDQTRFHISIIAPDGNQIDLPLSYVHGTAFSGRHFVKQKDIFTKLLVLNEWYDFLREGHYRIKVTLDIPLVKNTSKLAQYQREEALLELTILPRNEAALKQTCENLLLRVQKDREIYDIGSLAEQLSYIKDPIAIPYLAKLAETKEVESIAVNGLRRIGTDEAMEAMIVVTKNKYEPIASLAKAILRKKVNDIKDLNIRNRVIDAVSK
jgi:hypothetical protein